jgi:O-antigen/teichoic acid export membrane protein
MSLPLAATERDGGAAPARHGVGGSVVAMGLVIELGAQFARTLLLARLLGATQFGLVTSINMFAALVDMLSFIGIDRYLVYSPDGGGRHVLAVAHTLAWLRGITSAALVVALAWPTAATIGAGDYVLGFMVVALGPLLRGAAHLGVVQMQRSGRFWPSTVADAGGALVGLVVGTVAALVAPDYRAILWALSAQAGSNILLTHIFARGLPYRLSLDPSRMRDALRYGLPLLANGLALAAAYQLDRMVVGAWLGVVAIGVYGLSVTLLLQPIALLLRLATTTLQPRLSAAWDADPSGLFPLLVRQFARYGAALGMASAVATACLGAPLLRLVFGPSFVVSDAFFALMAGVVLVRLNRGALNLLGLAIGRTADLMVSNIVGASALPVMIGAFAVHAGPASAAFGVLVGDIVAFAVADARLRRHCGSADRAIRHGLAIAAVLPAALGAWVVLADPPLWSRTIVAAAGLLAAASVLLATRAPQANRVVTS